MQELKQPTGLERLDPSALELATNMLTNPTNSDWLKNALRGALRRDCVDAMRDAEQLLMALRLFLPEFTRTVNLSHR